MKKNIFFILLVTLIICPINNIKACNKNNPNLNLFKKEMKTIQTLNKNIYLTDKDIYLMAQVVYAESAAEPFEGKVAVASVILNRVKDSRFPKCINQVIKQKYAFSCIKNGEINVTPNEDSYKAVLEALKGRDPTKKAVFFYNPKISTCSWMKNVNKNEIKNIGNHTFFKIK